MCYVGITRAKKNLYISSADSRLLFGRDEHMLPSIFIREMEKELINNKPKYPTFEYKKKENKKEIKKEETVDNSNIKVGDKINHKLFGDGMVVSVVGQTLTVAFSVEVGIKKLMANHPSIRKI